MITAPRGIAIPVNRNPVKLVVVVPPLPIQIEDEAASKVVPTSLTSSLELFTLALMVVLVPDGIEVAVGGTGDGVGEMRVAVGAMRVAVGGMRVAVGVDVDVGRMGVLVGVDVAAVPVAEVTRKL